MKKPLVSAVLPIYNPKKEWLEKAVKSVLNQSYSNLEIVLLNDGSEKKLDEYLQTNLLEDDRVRTFHQDNKGFVKATNNAVERANGKYIAPLAQDDFWKKNKIKDQTNKLEEKDNEVALSKAEVIDPEGRKVGTKGEIPSSNRLEKLFFGCYPCYETLIINKDFFEEIGKMNEAYDLASDWDLWFRIFGEASITYLDESLTFKRRHSEKSSVLNYKKITEEGEKLLKINLEKYEKSSDFRKEVLCSFYRKKGRRYFERGEKKSARELWNKSLRTNPLDIKSWVLYISSITEKSYNGVNEIYSLIRGDKRTKVAKN